MRSECELGKVHYGRRRLTICMIYMCNINPESKHLTFTYLCKVHLQQSSLSPKAVELHDLQIVTRKSLSMTPAMVTGCKVFFFPLPNSGSVAARLSL